VSGRRAALLLSGILLVALALRLWHIGHGLPFAYNADEAEHFVPKAIEMFRGGLDPHYYENPSALTYLFYAIFKLRFTAGFPFGGGRELVRGFAADPEAAFLTARVAVALIGTLVVGLVYWAGTRWFDRRAGLVAAAVMAVSFLPVFYSKHALNDVVTLAPLTVALVACLLVYERGWWADWALAGAAIGVATATKYTAGAMVLALCAWSATAGSCGPCSSAWRSPAPSACSASPRSIRTRSSTRPRRAGRSAASPRRPTRRSWARTTPTAGSTTSARSPGASAGCRCWRPWRGPWWPRCATGAGRCC
jgi:hypothetical protein